MMEMENTFDSTYIINKTKYDEFVNEASQLAVAVYTIPAFVWLELYKGIDIHKDIAMRQRSLGLCHCWLPDSGNRDGGRPRSFRISAEQGGALVSHLD